jgi:hypothetical protein
MLRKQNVLRSPFWINVQLAKIAQLRVRIRTVLPGVNLLII